MVKFENKFPINFYLLYRHSYKSGEWYWNGGFYPASVLLAHRYLAHAVKIRLGTHMLVDNLYYRYWPEWNKTLDACHLLINHRSYLDKNSPIKEFNEQNVKNYNFTFGFIARGLLDRAGGLLWFIFVWLAIVAYIRLPLMFNFNTP